MPKLETEGALQKKSDILYWILEGEDGFEICVDFTTSSVMRRHKQQDEALLRRALQLKKYPHPFVVDATAGFGQDAFVIASLGCRVLMLERCAPLAALLQDGLSRAQSVYPDVIERLSIIEIDALTYLPMMAERPDIVYLDPMYPAKNKFSLSKKPMQILQKVLPLDTGDALLAVARSIATRRVVVKRAPHAPALAGVAPDYSVAGKSVRFDVYLL